ncbi:MAG: PKD domain-containing protein, partial [Cytophagaceae bacterium]
NGVVIGSVMRDIEFSVINCNNNIPTLSGINNTASDSIGVCAGSNICFNIFGKDADANQNLTMSWNKVIDTTKSTFVVTGTSKTPKAKFCWQTSLSDIGLHQFTVKITDDFCPIVGENTKTYKIRVYPNPKVTLPADMVIACNAKASLSPTVTQAVAPFYYKWNTGEITSTVSKGQGYYTVKVTDGHGCVGSDDISVNSGIFAGFTNTKKCVGQTVSFKDTSVSLAGTIVAWTWDFNDPASGLQDSSHLQNPTHTFTKSGIFNVKLTVTDNNGCKGTVVRQVKFCDIPKADFVKMDSCQYKTLPYLDRTKVTTCGIQEYIFSTGDGRGAYVDTLVVPFSVAPYLAPYYPGNPFVFDFPNGNGDFPPDSGVFNVKLVAINENGCKDSVTKKVTIYNHPKLILLETDYYFDCSNPTKTLHSTNSGGHPPRKLMWSTGETTDSIIINKPGTYSVTVTDAYGCDTTAKVDVMWPIAPQYFTSPYCKSTDPIHFTDLTISQWGLASWNYTFGDGSSSSLQYPSHVYTGNQVYNTKLVVTDVTGCKDSISLPLIHVLPDSIFQATPTPLCLGQPLNIKSPTGEFIDSLIWDFGNGVLSSFDTLTMQKVYTPNRKFTYAGNYLYPAGSEGNTYTVKLRVMYNNKTCIKDYSTNISIFPAFSVGIDSLTGQCAGDVSRFYGSQKQGPPDPNIVWNWKFYYDDPATGNAVPEDSSTLQNPTAVLPSPTDYDNFHAVLTATNTDGCVVSTPNANFAILDLPPPVICADRHCATQQTQFFYFCNVFPEVVIDSVHWDFGDGTPGTSAFEPFHIYADSGTYIVKAEIFNFAFGCSQSATVPVKMYLLPDAQLQTSDTCLGLPMSFKDLSNSVAPDTISSWYWDFGDGTSSASQNPTHTYSSVGSYNVKLIVTNSISGCKDTSVVGVANVRPYPTAGFTVNTNELVTGRPVLFTDMSTGGVRWLWRYGDGDSAVIVDPLNKNPEHTYAGTVKSATVTEIVTNQFGCSDTASMELDLNIFFVLPNAFSPNGDNNNDTFFPQYKGIASIQEFKIYDRWGQKVYEGDGDMKAAWDGKYKGEDQPLGVYVYYAKAVAYNGEEFVQSGKLTLLR